MIKAVQFLNQVQAGFGGDEQMNITPQFQHGAVGLGTLLRSTITRYGGEIVGTVICGDNYFLENRENAIEEILDMIKKLNADVVICGPALNYKRYGECCGYLVEAIENKLHIPAFAAMSKDSNGLDMFRNKMYIIENPNRGGIGLNQSLKKMSSFAVKMALREKIGTPEEEGYFSRD